MKGFGKQTILLATGPELKLYTLSGTELMAFKDHHNSITSIWVVYTVTITYCYYSLFLFCTLNIL